MRVLALFVRFWQLALWAVVARVYQTSQNLPWVKCHQTKTLGKKTNRGRKNEKRRILPLTPRHPQRQHPINGFPLDGIIRMNVNKKGRPKPALNLLH